MGGDRCWSLKPSGVFQNPVPKCFCPHFYMLGRKESPHLVKKYHSTRANLVIDVRKAKERQRSIVNLRSCVHSTHSRRKNSPHSACRIWQFKYTNLYHRKTNTSALFHVQHCLRNTRLIGGKFVRLLNAYETKHTVLNEVRVHFGSVWVYFVACLLSSITHIKPGFAFEHKGQI